MISIAEYMSHALSHAATNFIWILFQCDKAPWTCKCSTSMKFVAV